MTTEVEICRWDSFSEPERARLIADLDHVFFASSARQSFADQQERTAFRERWLGRYLSHFPQYVWIACSADGHAVGYVIGSHADPAHDPLFADLPFLGDFSALTARYPAQLHVNLADGWRGRGIGARLVQAFGDAARAAGAPGVHVVTGAGMRNVSFYLANGFAQVGSTVIDGRELLLLGRTLS
jgi:GNAT superfamily N-acetyltransferase